MSKHSEIFRQFVAKMPRRLNHEQLLERFEHYLLKLRSEYSDDQIAELSAAFAKWLKGESEGDAEKAVKVEVKPTPKTREGKKDVSPGM